MIRGDSGDYDLLEKWSKNFDCKGHHTCELGVREGQGSKIIIDNVLNNYFHIGVDPYGDLKYKHFDNDEHFHWDHTVDGRPPTYPDSMRDQMIKDFADYTNRGKFHFVNTTDVDFMNSESYKRLSFSFVHFDGPHTTKEVLREAIWFADRSAEHTRFVFDDHIHYRMDIISHALTYWNFKTIESATSKICLEKYVRSNNS
tara:strand:- start:155 stop:754 length:600 start_codon:yes stop_codon:yes gene_type:complete